jgi:osmoprotectant transport system permease protein
MTLFTDAWSYLTDSANWPGPSGIATRIAQHLWYSLVAVACASAIAIPIGALIGHTGRGAAALVAMVNALRALPTLGLMTLLVLLYGLGLVPPITALVVLAVPPLLAGTYAGIVNVDAAVVDASRAMGMTQWQVLTRAELPNALPLILGGLRGATLQVIATATIAAFVNLGGLGRYIFDGLALYRYDLVLVGAILVAALACIVDGLLAAAVWLSIPGTGRAQRAPIKD